MEERTVKRRKAVSRRFGNLIIWKFGDGIDLVI
jgi:hypothetical protein